jgi:hypothetical protein
LTVLASLVRDLGMPARHAVTIPDDIAATG